MEKKIGQKSASERNIDKENDNDVAEAKFMVEAAVEKKVSIILLNYKGYEDTKACINSLKEIDYKNFNVIVVDNDSQDGSLEKLQQDFNLKSCCSLEASCSLKADEHSRCENITKESQHFITVGNEEVHFMASGKNGGFAYGNNRGIELALSKGAEYVLLINTDTLVEKDFLNILVEEAESRQEVGVVTGKILYESKRDSIWFGGGEINWSRFYGAHSHYEDARYITFSTGCLMLIKKSVFEKVGLLPEQYFMYYEDVDFCAMLQDAGFKIYYTPKSVIYHKVSASTGGEESPFAVYLNTKNRLRFMNKYKNKKGYLKGKAFFYATRVPILMKYVAKGRGDKAKSLIKGLKGN